MDGTSIPPSALPFIPRLTKEQASKKKHDVGETSKPPTLAASDSSDSSAESEALVTSPVLHRDLVSPFLFTSDEESSEDEDEDPPFVPPSPPERPQSRSRRSNPPLPKSCEVGVGLPAPGHGVSHQRGWGKDKGNRKVD